MSVIKYLLLLPLVYLFLSDFFNDMNDKGVAVNPLYLAYNVAKEKKQDPLFSGKLTASGSKENKLTQSQAEDVFYKKVSVNKFEPKPIKTTTRSQVNNNRTFSPLVLMTDGFSSLIDGNMPKDKNSIIVLLLLFFVLYKTQEVLFSKK
jgi:hypothetical protein